MTGYECGANEDAVLEVHAILDLVDANVTPLETTNEWRHALTFAEDESRADHAQSSALAEILEGIGEQA